MAETVSKHTKLLNDIKFFISTNFFGYRDELLEYLTYPFKQKNQPEQKFVVFSSGRSGSTLLISLLNSHADIYCESEILKHKVLFPLNKVKLRTNLSGKKVYGFKFLGYQLKNIQQFIKNKKAFIEKLHQLGYKIIYLERENRLNQALSNMYAFHSNQWHITNPEDKKDFKMRVDTQELKNWLDDLEENNRFEKDMLEGVQHLYISYEQHLATEKKRDDSINKIAEFLEVANFTAKTNLRKIVPKSFDDFMTNADEVRTFLRSTGYSKYLPENTAVNNQKVGN